MRGQRQKVAPMQGNHSRSSESQPSADSALVEALLQSRVIIEEVEPRVGCGRHAARAVVGRPLEVSATLIADGIEHIAARLLWRHCDEPRWQSTAMRSEEHTSELQSRGHLVCRLLREKKKRAGSTAGESRLSTTRRPSGTGTLDRAG